MYYRPVLYLCCNRLLFLQGALEEPSSSPNCIPAQPQKSNAFRRMLDGQGQRFCRQRQSGGRFGLSMPQQCVKQSSNRLHLLLNRINQIIYNYRG